MDYRKRAIELYKKGETIEVINKKIGIPLELQTIENWKKEDEIKNRRVFIIKLQKQQKSETNYDKRKEILLKLTKQLEEMLELIPDDINTQTQLMYANINLKNIEKARKMAYSILSKSETKEVLNGLSIIEEMSGNYDLAIQMTEKILEKDPENEFYKRKVERLNGRKTDKKNNEPSEKDKLYAQIATLERSARTLVEEKQHEMIMKEEQETSLQQITQEAYKETYEKVKDISQEILDKFPNEILAKERLLKACYITGEIEEAKEVAQEILSKNNKSEITLWYLAKIERTEGNLQKEKEYLEQIGKNSKQGISIKISQRIEKINTILEKQNKEENIEQKSQYTEEDRRVWLDEINRKFLYGELSKADIDKTLEHARKYPNFTKSLIEILELECKMTENFEEKIEKLERYMDSEYSISKQDYKDIMEEITRTRKQMEELKKDDERGEI